MSDIQRIDLELVKEVEWLGDGTQYDLDLQALSNESEFLVPNPWFEDQALQYYINDIPSTDQCVVWKNNGIWVAKYFTQSWQPHDGYLHIDFDYPKLVWRKNPDLDRTIQYTEEVYGTYMPDPYESSCELIWYIDSRFDPDDVGVWAFKCSPISGRPINTKTMGEVIPRVNYEFNKELPDFKLDINELLPPYYYLANECYYNLDKQYTSDLDLWVVKFTPAYRTPKLPLCIGTIAPQLTVTHNPALPKLDYGDIDYGITWDYLKYEHVWMLNNQLCESSPEEVWAFKVKAISRPKKKLVVDYVMPRPLDVIFISYNEPNAEDNWQRLLDLVPHAQRVDGVEGIMQAHQAAAKLASSDMFFVVDGDAYIEDATIFEYQPGIYDRDCTFIWHSRNPINDLEYGNGGVKLFPTNLVLDAVDWTTLDFSTTINTKLKVLETVSNINRFNVDAETVWRSAFRECVKLYASGTEENLKRLYVWKSTGLNREYGKYAIAGAYHAIDFVDEHPDDLNKINDRNWLNEQFKILNG
jgi:hypothetical protein